jgi:hypothetical protein
LAKGGLDLQTRDSASRKLESGERAVVPGDPAASEALRRVMITDADDAERMPPHGDRLTGREIAILRDWIAAGAPYEEHWSYRRPVRPPLPPGGESHPIDRFVRADLKVRGLAPSPAADPTVLLRRLSLDLTGLPPMPADVDAFVEQHARDPRRAVEIAFDRLTASPAYGEHLARWWLDLARYADTDGYEKDNRRSIWPYRDWVIDAFRKDMPFDQFTIRQIAGDLLPNARTADHVATGFHRNTMTNTEGGADPEEFRVAAVVDRVNTTAEVWLGSTLACAQCHNHKYDPVTQAEYFRLFAFFDSTEDSGNSHHPVLELPSEDDDRRRARLRRDIAMAGVAAMSSWPSALLTVAPARKWKDELNSVRPPTTLVMKERSRPRETRIHVRGNHRSPGEKVLPGTPGKLHPLSIRDGGGATATRLDLARWLVDPANPLVGRVTVNRLWARVFGRGIVETGNDFGLQGELPTHPELLDWLAVEFVEQGWSVRSLLKLIITSETYQQSSVVRPDLRDRDPDNRWYARGPRFRLDAETIRDNALAIGGLLDRTVGGPPVMPHQPDGIWAAPYSGDRWQVDKPGARHRRGVYTFWRRTAPYAQFVTFDAPSRETACERRPRSNTPLQALATLNDVALLECAGGLAAAMAAAGGDDAGLTEGFRRCVARKPAPTELAALRRLLADARAEFQKRPERAEEFARQASTRPELAAWTLVANALLNLDETITKN